MDLYGDLLNYLNETTVKLKELLEKVTTLNNEVSKGLLETLALFNPEILTVIAEMAVNGSKCDKRILEGEQVKNDLEKLLDRPGVPSEDYERALKELDLLQTSLKENFHLEFNNL